MSSLPVLSEFFVFPCRIEAGAVFLRIQVPVSHDEGMGEEPLQFAQQGKHRPFLWEGPRVGGSSVSGQSAFVADAYGVPVVVAAVCPYLFQRASRMYRCRMWSLRQVSKSRLRPSGVAEQWMIIRVMRLMFLRFLISAGADAECPCHGRSYGDDDFEDDAPHAFRCTVFLLHKNR